MQQRKAAEAVLSSDTKLATMASDIDTYFHMAEEEKDSAQRDTLLKEIEREMAAAETYVSELETVTLLSGENDRLNAIMTIKPGAGGMESQDWAEMLLRMYSRWAEQHGYKLLLIDESAGDEAGIKSATIQVCGDNAYGWLKTESGVHRLVRISPFDSQARRHTSFTAVTVWPVIEGDIDIEIDEKDLRVDTFRASGAGGQHVNKTDSAVRLTHLPTGIVVSCQADRSQHRNRATAMAMLKARLYEAELQKREAEAAKTEASKTDIGWGHQIRSYVLQPYQMVKDLRTGVETSQTQAVLDGDLDRFMAASLAARVGGGAEANT